jgi:hypothetical protein
MNNFTISKLQTPPVDYNENTSGVNYFLKLTTKSSYTTTVGTRTVSGDTNYGNYNYPLLGMTGDTRQYTDDDRPAKGILFPR